MDGEFASVRSVDWTRGWVRRHGVDMYSSFEQLRGHRWAKETTIGFSSSSDWFGLCDRSPSHRNPTRNTTERQYPPWFSASRRAGMETVCRACRFPVTFPGVRVTVGSGSWVRGPTNRGGCSTAMERVEECECMNVEVGYEPGEMLTGGGTQPECPYPHRYASPKPVRARLWRGVPKTQHLLPSVRILVLV